MTKTHALPSGPLATKIQKNVAQKQLNITSVFICLTLPRTADNITLPSSQTKSGTVPLSRDESCSLSGFLFFDCCDSLYLHALNELGVRQIVM